MRTSPIVIALLFAATQAQSFLDIAKGIQNLDLTNADIKFDAALPCGSCARSGNQFCVYKDGTTPSLCRNDQVAPFDNDLMVCSPHWVDQFNAVNNFCYPAGTNKRPVGCSAYSVGTIAENKAVAKATVTGLTAGQSCVFRVQGTCAYLAASLAFLHPNTKGDYDIAIGTSEMLATEDLDPAKPDFPFVADKNATSYNANSNDASGDLKVDHPINQAAFDACNGVNQNLFMIVTRLTVTPPAPETTELAEVSRVLAPEMEDLVISFKAWAGKKSAMRLLAYTSAALAAAVFALF